MSEKERSDLQRDRAEQAALNQAQAQAPTVQDKRAYMEAVLSDDIDNASVDMIANLFSQSHKLANLEDAEVHEIKKLREITLKKIFAAHPNQRSAMQGERRAQVYGEDAVPLKPLSQIQEEKIRTAVRSAFSDLTRGREGFQQEMFSKSVSESHVERPVSDSNGWLSFK